MNKEYRLNYSIFFGGIVLLSALFCRALYLNVKEEERNKRESELIDRILEKFDSNQNGILERDEYSRFLRYMCGEGRGYSD